MKRKSIIITGITAFTLLAVSILTGIYTANNGSTGDKAAYNTETCSPAPLPEDVADTFTSEANKKYKIILADNNLMLYYEDELLNKTNVSADVLPRADIKALTAGIEYKSIEEALVDWESLCN